MSLVGEGGVGEGEAREIAEGGQQEKGLCVLHLV